MLASVLVKFVGKVCNLLNLFPSLLLLWPLALVGAGGKHFVHIWRRSLYEENIDSYLSFTHSWFPMTPITISFIF